MEGFQDIEHFVESLYAAIKKKIPTKVSQLTNDAGYKTTDTNTTYKLSKSGSTVTLTGSDGSTTSVTDSNTTYSSLKNPYSLTVQNNGTTVASYDGSAAKTANFTNATSSADGLMSKTDKAKLDGIASSPSMLTNLGSTAAANVFQASPRPGVTGVLPIANGGTGASSLEGLRSNLDIETTLDTTCNILVDNWVQDKTSLLYSNTVSVAGVKEGYVYDIDAYKGNLTTSAEVEAYNNDFSCISGGYAEAEEGKITFTVVDKPAANITVRVKGTQAITTEETQSDEINNQKSTITDLQSKLAKITDKIYPVGSIYISANSTSPADLLGGTWEQIKDRFLLAAGDTYSAGSTGGEAQHTLTVGEIPSHSHEIVVRAQGYDGWGTYTSKAYGIMFKNSDTVGYHGPNYTAHSVTVTNDADTMTNGGSQPHNNMPPYLAVCVWKRTA